ncbi:MAG: hypothetical protein R3C56_23160 [Pirellulaceae bacterium]
MPPWATRRAGQKDFRYPTVTGRYDGLHAWSCSPALLYVGALCLAQLVAGQGALVMYFQHAFLVPAPLISS